MTDSSITSGFELNARLENGRIVVEMAVTAAAAIDLPGLRLAVQNARAPLALIIDRDERGFRAPRLSLASPPVGLPSAAEAALDLPGAIGGGRLEYSPAEDTWRGAVTVRVGPVSVQGFAIVSGLAGRFSLLVLLSAEFTPPLQLPFGFTLQGVGGMVGVNRRPDIGALTTALRDGDLSKLLFPQNAARESARLLPVLDRCFPGSPGDFVVGPMLKIGWPTPALVSATVGVLIASTSVIVLGRVAITLPFEQAALIRLEAFVLGVVDGTGLLLSATLTNSHIVGIPVEGDIRLCVRTGANPQFAISAGGFHPAYTPPDGMADMKRIGMQISPGPILCARLSAYLGVTTDSVHFGATVHLSAGFDGFKISGRFAFDALIALAPFGFHAGFRARVAVECADFEVASIELGGQFSGPAPYRISGHATVSILFFDVDIDLPEISWGSRESAVLPAARDPLATLVGELRRRECWTPTDPSGVLGSKIRPGVEAGVLLHPQGQMQFRQNAVPLNVLLTRMDAVQLPIPVTITVEDGAGDRLEMLRCAFVA
ncbi:DUF6603 domain-containing protein, partial [Nocardia takedensis]